MTSSTLVGDAVSTHGFSTQFIEDVVSNCSVLFTVGDVLHTCTVFTLSHAQRTFTKFFNRHGLIVVKYCATLREIRFAIQA